MVTCDSILEPANVSAQIQPVRCLYAPDPVADPISQYQLSSDSMHLRVRQLNCWSEHSFAAPQERTALTVSSLQNCR